MNDYRWLNHGHPQTLQTATILLYIEGVLGLFGGYFGEAILICVGLVVGGFGIANDKKWGYAIALVAAILNVVYIYSLSGSATFTHALPLISLMFAGALVALLLHPMSRSYQRIWFR